MKSWQEIGFEVEITGDGSPSLHLIASVDPTKPFGETMHHSGGAYTETDLIYGTPIHELFKKVNFPQFLIVGLGLGYIEMVIAREALQTGKEIGCITSFESVPELRTYFVRWLHDHDLHPEVQKTYDEVLASVLSGSNVLPTALKQELKKLFKTENDVRGALDVQIQLSEQYHCILYDAFSSKTTPHLWDESFLNEFLKKASAETCVLSTYACRGSLKRALANQGFEVIIRDGFRSKRNSTLAKKNLT